MIDVLIPSAGPPESFGVTLASLASQRYERFRVAASAPDAPLGGAPQITALAAILQARGHPVRFHDVTHPAIGRRRQALVDQAGAPYLLLVDDGVFLQPDLIGRLIAAMRSARCGFIGSAVIDLRAMSQPETEEESIEFWDGPVRPEEISVASPAWDRRRLHRDANLQHVRERLPHTRDRLYRVADIHGCVLYDTAKLRAVGGFNPARSHDRDPGIPPNPEAATQLRLMARHGGAGLFPSGAYRLWSDPSRPPPDGSTWPIDAPWSRHTVARHPSSLSERASRRHGSRPVAGGQAAPRVRSR